MNTNEINELNELKEDYARLLSEIEELRRDYDELESNNTDLKDFIKFKGLEDEFMSFINN